MKIPHSAKIYLAIILFVASCVGAAAIGAKVATWKANSGHAATVTGLHEKISTLRSNNHELESAILRANQSVSIAEARAEAAREAQQAAKRHADDLAAFSQARMDKLEQAFLEATSCGEVLAAYWEIKR